MNLCNELCNNNYDMKILIIKLLLVCELRMNNNIINNKKIILKLLYYYDEENNKSIKNIIIKIISFLIKDGILMNIYRRWYINNKVF